MRIVRELLLLLLFFGVCGAGVYALWHFWPAGHDSSHGTPDNEVTVQVAAEGKLRELLRREIVIDAVKDPIVTRGIREIHDRLAPAVGELKFPVEIHVIDSPTINAVCLPGGLIIVYSGLIRRLAAPEELAAVLAHETAHAMHGDAMQALVRELGIVALLTLAGGQSDALTVRLMHRLVSSGFSRQQESAADQEAQRLLTAADIDPGAFAEAMRHIRKASDGDDSDDPEVLQYVSTHPDTDSRIKSAEAASAAWKGKARPFSLDWKHLQARFRVLR